MLRRSVGEAAGGASLTPLCSPGRVGVWRMRLAGTGTRRTSQRGRARRTMAVEIVCEDCGSAEVTRDAWAAWDATRQEWTLGTVFDDGYCHTCEREAALRERVILRVVEGGR